MSKKTVTFILKVLLVVLLILLIRYLVVRLYVEQSLPVFSNTPWLKEVVFLICGVVAIYHIRRDMKRNRKN